VVAVALNFDQGWLQLHEVADNPSTHKFVTNRSESPVGKNLYGLSMGFRGLSTHGNGSGSPTSALVLSLKEHRHSAIDAMMASF